MNKNYISAAFTAILFVCLICFVRFADVEAIGPENTSIGLSALNKAVHNVFGQNDLWYKITNVLGGIAILTGCVFVMMGLVQLVKGRDLKKVDRSIYAVGVLYGLMAFFYVLFEKVIINYRPIIVPGDEHVEASFPSSHTMLVTVIMGSAFIMIGKYVKNRTAAVLLKVLSLHILRLTVAGRLISGYHWFTDIVGGILLALTLLFVFAGALDSFDGHR